MSRWLPPLEVESEIDEFRVVLSYRGDAAGAVEFAREVASEFPQVELHRRDGNRWRRLAIVTNRRRSLAAGRR